jgi:hypothetical protein
MHITFLKAAFFSLTKITETYYFTQNLLTRDWLFDQKLVRYANYYKL